MDMAAVAADHFPFQRWSGRIQTFGAPKAPCIEEVGGNPG